MKTTYALTLIGTATTQPLLATHVDQVYAALNLACEQDWLAESLACDLVFTSDFTSAQITSWAQKALKGTAIDVVCTPIEGRRKRILISDMDSTIIDQECIDELGEIFGVGPSIREITQKVITGRIGFSDALRQRLALMKGMQNDLLERVYNERITLKPGARTLVQTMRQNGAYCILVSGGFSFFTNRIAEALGFNDHQANELLFSDGKLTGEVSEPILGRTAKLETLNRLCKNRGVEPAEVLAVGDGANDIKMIAAAGIGVAFHGSDSLKAQANTHINYADLTALLYIQGYRKSEFKYG